MTSPEPIIYLDPETNEFKLNLVQYDKIFQNEKTKRLPVSIISIAGDCRKGKSFVLNFFLRFLEFINEGEEGDDPNGWVDIEGEPLADWIGDVNNPLKGFSWKSGVEAVTVGIIIWPEPLIVTRSDGTKIAVLLMDTQGLFDDNTEHRDVGRFYAISSLISSVQIYNQMGQFQSNDLTTLTAFSSYGRRVSNRTGHKAFQNLLILIRDWVNHRQFNYGSRGGQEYLEHKRQSLSQKYGSQWREIESCYDEIACFLLPSIGDDACTDEKFDGSVRSIRRAFITHINSLVQAILSPDKLIVKTLDGEEQELWKMGIYISQLTDKLKDNDSVEIDDLLAASDETKVQNAVSDVFLLYLIRIKEFKEREKPICRESLDKAEREAITLYWNKTEFVERTIKNEKFDKLHELLVTTRKKIESSKDTSWIHKLYETFEKNLGTIGKVGGIAAFIGTAICAAFAALSTLR